MYPGIIILILMHTLIQGLNGLRIMDLRIPSPIFAGESVELTCGYDLEDDRLYSVKWYKDGSEFYRYVPKDWPHAQVLPMDGIKVDTTRSASSTVYLRYVDLNSAGKYRCEISAEAPSFNTAAAEKDMEIYHLPTEDPQISVGQTKYNPNEEVIANCTSPKSRPSAKLSWYINDVLVGSELKTEHSTTLHNDGLESSFVSLNFVIKEQHFVKDSVTLKCTSLIPQVQKISRAQVTLYRTDGPTRKSYTIQRDTLSENLSQVGDFSSPTINRSYHWGLLVILFLLINLITTNHLNIIIPMVT